MKDKNQQFNFSNIILFIAQLPLSALDSSLDEDSHQHLRTIADYWRLCLKKDAVVERFRIKYVIEGSN
jgi:hypothetical protein